MSEVNRWGLGLLLMVLIWVGVEPGASTFFFFASAVLASVGFVLFTHEKKAGQEDENECN